MKRRSRLNHAAAGLLTRFIAHYNSIEGLLALGVLYSEVLEAPYRIDMDLLDASVVPSGPAADQVAAEYSARLRTALVKLNFPWDALACARITIEFKANRPTSTFWNGCPGDPFVCSIELQSTSGDVAKSELIGRCEPRHTRKL